MVRREAATPELQSRCSLSYQKKREEHHVLAAVPCVWHVSYRSLPYASDG